MKRTIVTTVCLIILLLFAANRSFAQSDAALKARIEKINKEMAKYMLEGNTEKSLSLYTDDAISMPSNEPMHEGIAAIRKSNEEMKKSGWIATSFETSTLKIFPNGSFVTEVGTYKMSMSMTGMNKPMDDHGKYVTVWEKQKDGSLKVKIETWNSDMSPMEQMKTMESTK